MSRIRISQQLSSPEADELEKKRVELAELESQLADRELELAALRLEFSIFQKDYLRTVGRRYAELDEIEAKLAEQ
jgi:hypothetical protein